MNKLIFRGLQSSVAALALTLTLTAPGVSADAASTEDVIAVSDSEFNQFLFADEVQSVYFPPGAPVSGKPIPVSDNKGMLIQFKKKSDKDGEPVVTQMVVQLKDGTLRTLRLQPQTMPGIQYSVEPSPAAARKTTVVEVDPYDRQLVDAFSPFVQGKVADSYTATGVSTALEFDRFTAHPAGAWTDGTQRMLSYRLVAKADLTTIVAPSQFYREGVLAVQLEGGDVITEAAPLMLFILTDESLWRGSK